MKNIKAAQKAVSFVLRKLADDSSGDSVVKTTPADEDPEENVYSQITNIQLNWKKVLQNTQLSAAQKHEEGKKYLAAAAALEQRASRQTKPAVLNTMNYIQADLRKIAQLVKQEARKPKT